jgi:hypothetical protein
MNAAFFIWIGIMVSVLSLGYYYMGQRLIMPFNLESPQKQIAWTVLSLMYLIPFSSFFMVRFAEKYTGLYSWIGYISLGFLSFVFVMLVFRDAAWFIGLGGQKLLAFFSTAPAVWMQQSGNSFCRRPIWACSGSPVHSRRTASMKHGRDRAL